MARKKSDATTVPTPLASALNAKILEARSRLNLVKPQSLPAAAVCPLDAHF
jgi:hypothetical protein